MRATITMLIDMSMGGNNKRIYEQEFENVLLSETAEYYRTESNRLIMDSSCSSYLTKAHARLQEEYERVASYLAPSTEPKLIEQFLREYVGEKHANTLMSMESSGLVHMIKNQKLDELHMLYNMFVRIPESF
jgi:cullin 3